MPTDKIRVTLLLNEDHPGLTFPALRQANLLRLPLFRNSKGEVAHAQADGSDWSIAEWVQATVGELGEFANVAKKRLRGDLSAEEFLVQARKELADVQIYLDILAYRCGVDLGDATAAKFNEVSTRVKAPIFLEEQ